QLRDEERRPRSPQPREHERHSNASEHPEGAATLRAAGDDERAVQFHRATAAEQRAVRRYVEEHVVLVPPPPDVLLRVVDDLVRAERTHDLDVPRSRRCGHVCAERLRDLDRERPDAAACAVDDDALPGLDAADVAETLERRRRCDGERGGLLEGELPRLRDEAVLARGRVLSERPTRGAKDFVARLEARDLGADRFDDARNVAAAERILRLSQAAPGHESDRELAVDEVVVRCIHRRRADTHEDTIVGERRLRDRPGPQHVPRAVPLLHDRLHQLTALALNRGLHRILPLLRGAPASVGPSRGELVKTRRGRRLERGGHALTRANNLIEMELTMREEIKLAIRDEMARGQSVVGVSEDVADAGGVLQVTAGRCHDIVLDVYYSTPF